MKKNRTVVLVILAVIVAASISYLVARHNREQSSSTPSPSSYGYNPNYADAIQYKRPELCQKIAYALASKPNDEIVKVTGEDAVVGCEAQAKVGSFGCECDSDAALNAMRVR